MEQIRLERAGRRHVDAILPALRKSDIDEVTASSPGRALDDTLHQAVATSDECFAVYLGGELVALSGVHVMSALTGAQPWSVHAAAVTRHRKAYLVVARLLLADMLAKYGRLENVILASNERAYDWLMFLGYRIARFPVIIDGVEFLRYSMDRKP